MRCRGDENSVRWSRDERPEESFLLQSPSAQSPSALSGSAPAGVLPLHRSRKAHELLRKSIHARHREADAGAAHDSVPPVARALKGKEARRRILRRRQDDMGEESDGISACRSTDVRSLSACSEALWRRFPSSV